MCPAMDVLIHAIFLSPGAGNGTLMGEGTCYGHPTVTYGGRARGIEDPLGTGSHLPSLITSFLLFSAVHRFVLRADMARRGSSHSGPSVPAA